MPIDKTGPHRTFRNIEFWADNGMIAMVDTDLAATNPDSPRVQKMIRPGLFLKQALGAYMSVWDRYPDEIQDARRMLEEAKEAVKLAMSQGDPFSIKVQEHREKHGDGHVQILMPGEREPEYKVHTGDPRRQFTGEEEIQVTKEHPKLKLAL